MQSSRFAKVSQAAVNANAINSGSIPDQERLVHGSLVVFFGQQKLSLGIQFHGNSVFDVLGNVPVVHHGNHGNVKCSFGHGGMLHGKIVQDFAGKRNVRGNSDAIAKRQCTEMMILQGNWIRLIFGRNDGH